MLCDSFCSGERRRLRGHNGGLQQFDTFFFASVVATAAAPLAAAMNNRKHTRHKKQGSYRREKQPANHGATQRGILFAAFSGKPSAIGTMPMIIASAVMITGRMRV